MANHLLGEESYYSSLSEKKNNKKFIFVEFCAKKSEKIEKILDLDFDFTHFIEQIILLLTDTWTVEDDLSSATTRILIFAFL